MGQLLKRLLLVLKAPDHPIKHFQKHGSNAESNFEQRFLRSCEKDLVPTLELIKTAVLNGELDTQIEAAAHKQGLPLLKAQCGNAKKSGLRRPSKLKIFNFNGQFSHGEK
jgi:hypothetical protein